MTLESVPTFILYFVVHAKSEKEFLLIGELAEISEVSRDTLRHYERKGVLPCSARSPKGYRLYSFKLIERVKLIRRALAVGFTLDEIARIFAERERGNAPCRKAHSLVITKLENIKLRLGEMELMRGELENLVFEWNKKLEKTSEDEPIYLLEDLASSKNGFGSLKKSMSENLHRRNKKENNK